MQIFFGSTNSGKVAEVKHILEPKGFTVLTPSDLQNKSPFPEVVEDLPTYEGNALKKAEAYFLWSGLPSLADDTGLEIEALGGAPGVLSARYAGEPSNPKKNIEKVLAALDGVVERKARFVSIVVLVGAGGKFSAEGELTGTIAKSRSGDGGFGYDSVFIPAHFEKTLAALKSEKSPIKTHRERALAALLEKVRESSLK